MTEPEALPERPAPALAPAPAPPKNEKVFVRWVVGFIAAGCVVGAAAGSGLALVFAAYKIPAASMWPTFALGEHVFANKLAKEPERGAIMVFRFPENRQQSFAKRVVGLPGDELTIADGEVSINGWKVPRCNLGPAWYRDADGPGDEVKHEGMVAVEFLGAASYLVFDDKGAPAAERQGPYDVKAGEYFVLGDNRGNSHDSRTWFAGQGGGVPLADTVGRVRGYDVPLVRKDIEGLAGLAPALDACLAKRPKETTPPPPKSTANTK